MQRGSPTELPDESLNAADYYFQKHNIGVVAPDLALVEEFAHIGLFPNDIAVLKGIVEFLSDYPDPIVANYSRHAAEILTSKDIPVRVDIPPDLELITTKLKAMDDEIAYLNATSNNCGKYTKSRLKKAKKSAANDPQLDLTKSQVLLVAESVSHAYAGEWGRYKEKWKTLINETGNDDMMSFAIVNMIQYSAPEEEIISLLKDGYRLADETAFALVQTNNVALLEKLRDYGLKTRDVKMDGKSLQSFATDINASQEMLLAISK